MLDEKTYKGLEKVHKKLCGKARMEGVSEPDFKWVCAVASKQYTTASWDGGGLKTTIEDLWGDWRETAKKSGKAGTHKEYIATAFGKAVGVAESVKPIVEAFRLSLWAKPDAPFLSHEAAGRWIQSVYEQEVDESQQRPHSYSDISVSARRKDGNERFLDDSEAYRKWQETGEKKDVGLWADLIKDMYQDWEIVSDRSVRTYSEPALKLRFENGSEQWWHVSHLSKDTVLGNLYRTCQEVAEKSRLWTLTGALEFILCAFLPTPGVSVTYSMQRGNFFGPVTITISAPTTVEEVAEAYQKVLDDAGVSPRRLSHKHALLLRLVYQMPKGKFSWSDRLRRWLEWIEEDSALANIGTWNARLNEDGSISNQRNAIQNMMKDCKTAVERTTWTGKPTPKPPKGRHIVQNAVMPPLPWEEGGSRAD